jgi:hypothetical protein
MQEEAVVSPIAKQREKRVGLVSDCDRKGEWAPVL